MTFAPLFCAMARQRRKETGGSRSPATKISHPKIECRIYDRASVGRWRLAVYKKRHRLVTHEPLSPASGGFRKFARNSGAAQSPRKGDFVEVTRGGFVSRRWHSLSS